MILTENKPNQLAVNEIWIQSAAQAIECINEKGMPTLFKVGDSLGFDLFGEPLPNVEDFFKTLNHKVALGIWNKTRYDIEYLN